MQEAINHINGRQSLLESDVENQKKLAAHLRVELYNLGGSPTKNTYDVGGQSVEDTALNLSAIYQAGKAAGIAWDDSSRESAVRELFTGRYPEGPFHNVEFRVPYCPHLKHSELGKYLKLSSGKLEFDRSGSQPPLGKIGFIKPADIQ